MNFCSCHLDARTQVAVLPLWPDPGSAAGCGVRERACGRGSPTFSARPSAYPVTFSYGLLHTSGGLRPLVRRLPTGSGRAGWLFAGDQLVALLHPVAARRPHSARPYQEAPRAIHKRQQRVHGHLAGQPPAFVDAFDQDPAQRGVGGLGVRSKRPPAAAPSGWRPSPIAGPGARAARRMPNWQERATPGYDSGPRGAAAGPVRGLKPARSGCTRWLPRARSEGRRN